MIEELHAKDLALIRDARMTFAPGLTVLTGETGAGKTALLSALKLSIGGRGDASHVRDGSAEALVEAVFAVTPECASALAEKGFPAEDGEAIVRRRVRADGRSKCYINDESAAVGTLSATVGALVDLHGQHEHQALLSPANHIGYLDRWASDAIAPLLSGYRGALESYRHAAAELEEARRASAASEFELEQARYICSQIDPVAPGEGEHDELSARLPVLRGGESLAQGASEALAAIGGDGGASELVSSAQALLERLVLTDPALSELASRADGAARELEDIALELRAYRDDVEFDPVALQEALDRMGALDGLVRRFGPTYEEMLSQWTRAQALLETAGEGPARIEGLERACSESRRALESAAAALEKARTEAAGRFCRELSADVADLSMAGASFEFCEEDLPFEGWGASGSKRYELLYSPAGGIAPRPLSKIASGGELSRVTLSIECLLASRLDPDGRTLVFDEVDAGIGGVTAQAVARRISLLSRTCQVIVVTHLPQVAAAADRHLLVEKSDGGEGAQTDIRAIDGDERVAELARMLSGSTDGLALEHARSLIAGARLGEGDGS